jgi:hypothetical protein
MLYNSIGYIGATLYLLGFFLLSIRKISGISRTFQFYNLCGAIGVSVAAIHNHDTPSIVLNLAWGTIALATIVLALLRHRR